jgi:NTE family protein
MTIKHLVLAGGGAAGFSVYGALKYLNQKSFFSLNNINSIYASSAGSIIGGLIILAKDWKLLDDYILKRPWNKLININPTALLNLWQQKGIFDKNMITEILKPFLKINDLNETITLKELYNKTKIDFYIYTTNLNSNIFEIVELSHNTHPDLEFCKAVSMSSAFPLMFEPICDNSNCYIDGGLLNNFPITNCIEANSNIDEILAINIESINSIDNIVTDTTLPLYLYTIIMKMYMLINKYNKTNNNIIKNIVNCKIQDNNLNKWSLAVTDVSIREEYINIGLDSAKKFLEIMDC